jgi:hypothetical protein
VISPRYRRASLRLIYSTVDEEVQLALRSLLSALLVKLWSGEFVGDGGAILSATLPHFSVADGAFMLADRLSLAASSLASEKREVVCKPGVSISKNHGCVHIACSTTTSPPGGRSLHESDSSRGGLSNRGQKSIQSLGHGRRGLCSWVGLFCLMCGLSANIFTFALLSSTFLPGRMPSAVIQPGPGAARAVELSKSNEGGAIRQGVCETVQRLRTPGHRLRQLRASTRQGPPGRSRSIKRKRPRSKTSASIAATRMGDAGDEGRCG